MKRVTIVALVIASVVVSPNGVTSQIVPCDAVKLTASDAEDHDRLGRAVSVKGDLLIAGAPEMIGGGASGLGAAYVWRRVGGEWVEEQKLRASDGEALDVFGFSVSVGQDVAIVGAPLHDDAGDASGSAYVFRWNGSVWIEEQELVASGASTTDFFGQSVSVSGDAALIGAYLDGDSGRAYVFRWDGNEWGEEQILFASDGAPGDFFGVRVSLDGDTALVSASRDDDACPGEPNCDSGSAYVFGFNGVAWEQEQKLTASDAAPAERFGRSISIASDVLLVGAASHETVGAAYVFRRNGGTWSEEQKLVASDAEVGDWFGVSVSIDGDWAVVGSHRDDDACPGDSSCDSGSAYLFHWNGIAWVEQAKLTAPDAVDGGQLFGLSVSTDGQTIVAGADSDPSPSSEMGAVYVHAVGPDGDEDGLADACDNCPDAPNADQGDCDGDDVGDACVPAGDFDASGFVDIIDYGFYSDCASGAGAPPDPAKPSCAEACLSAFDFDKDSDIDLSDYAAFQLIFATP